MKLINITSETALREWLGEWALALGGVSIQWVEPAMYGSTMGAADAIVKVGTDRVDLELKYLYRTRKGIKFTLRPAQRRYHRMTMIRGGRTALLCIENGSKRLFLVRGDHVPLRDYASDFDSKCGPDEEICWPIYSKIDIDAMSVIKLTLFDQPNWWTGW